MIEPGLADGDREIAFEAYGVRMSVKTNAPELLDRVRPYLPPGSQACPPSALAHRFELTVDERGSYTVGRDGDPFPNAQGLELDLALELLDAELRIQLGRNAPDTVFIHAGAIGYGGQAMVIPGQSFAGKTTLVTALVCAGATYYSDEFAVLDETGLVHPYAKPLSIRGDDFAQSDHPIEAFGVPGDGALPLGAIVVTTYRRDAEWAPRRLSAGAGALALLEKAVPAQERPDQVMRTVARAAEGAIVIESDRGEAEEVAPLLLAELERAA